MFQGDDFGEMVRGQQPKATLYALPDCRYMIRAGDPCGAAGGPQCALGWAPGACAPTQLPGGCCQLGFSCR